MIWRAWRDRLRQRLRGAANELWLPQTRPHLAPLPPARELMAQADATAEATAAGRDGCPIPAPADREHYHEDRHLEYWLGGLEEFRAISERAAAQGLELGKDATVLDLGSASGRVARHFAMQLEGTQVVAADISEAHVRWMERHLTHPRLLPLHVSALPHLPLADASVDLCYALSVFTHSGSFELAWLSEIARTLKPGGLAYISFHSEDTWRNIDDTWQLRDALLGDPRAVTNRSVSADLFRAPMPVGREEFAWARSGAYSRNVFHHTEYIKAAWGKIPTPVQFISRGSGYQDVVILKA